MPLIDIGQIPAGTSITTINAIVTLEDNEYIVYFNQSHLSMLGPDSDRYWYIAEYFGDDLAGARAYVDRLVLADDWSMQIMRRDNRISAGNYQGCWNAPIVYSVSRKHGGDLRS